jgi:hypothetical protein
MLSEKERISFDCGSFTSVMEMGRIGCSAVNQTTNGDILPAQPARRNIGTVLGLGAIVLAFVAFSRGCHEDVSNITQDTSVSQVTGKPEPTPKELAMKNTYIAKWGWYKDDFGDIMMANFTIQDNSDTAIKDIEIRCDHSAPSGTVIDSNTRTIYEIVKAHSKRTFKNFNMGFIHSQAASSSCVIENLELAG